MSKLTLRNTKELNEFTERRFPPVSKEIIVNVGERETRIAVTEDGKLVEMHIERAERVVGSLYKCRVANVLPGMDAAFVDIGLERNAFLYVGDVLPTGDDASSGDAEASRKSADRRPRVGQRPPPEWRCPDRRHHRSGCRGRAVSAEEAEAESAEEPARRCGRRAAGRCRGGTASAG